MGYLYTIVRMHISQEMITLVYNKCWSGYEHQMLFELFVSGALQDEREVVRCAFFSTIFKISSVVLESNCVQ